MDDSNYTSYNYHTSINQDNTTNSLNPKKVDYNKFNDEHVGLNKRTTVSKSNVRLRNNDVIR